MKPHARRSVVATLCAVSAVAVMAACLPPSAQAVVRNGSATFAAPEYLSPSLEPRPPVEESVSAPGAVSVSYDDAGTLTLHYRNYNAAYYGDRMPNVSFWLYRSCDHDGKDEEDEVFTGEMGADEAEFGDGPSTKWIWAERAGYAGRAKGIVTFDGATFTGTITNAGLAGFDVRCAKVNVGVLNWDTNVNIPRAFIHFDNVPAPPVPPDPRKIADSKPTYLLAGPFLYSETTSRRVRPMRFGLWGGSMAESGHYLKIRWSKWGRSVAIGHGKAVALHGERKNGRLVFTRTPMRLKLSRPVLCGRSWVFTRITYRSKYGTFRRAIPDSCRS